MLINTKKSKLIKKKTFDQIIQDATRITELIHENSYKMQQDHRTNTQANYIQ